MQRKEINIFSISFLDLLSGALGAVLILFIIIPKMTMEQQNALDEMERLDIQSAELVELLEQIRHSMPEELSDNIHTQISDMRGTIDELSQSMSSLRQRLMDSETENSQLREQVRQAQRQLENERAQNRNMGGEKFFGVNAQLGIVCIWPENIDVDLIVRDLSTGTIGYYGNTTTPFGILMEDVRERSSALDDRYELFYQPRIVPGQYQIFVNIYKDASLTHSTSATVDGHVVMFPGADNEKKINFRRIQLERRGENVLVGTLTVSSNDITLEQ